MIPILVVSYGHLDTTTAPCLQSVRRYTGRRYRVQCIDNGSTDQTVAYLRRLAARDPRFEPVLLSENRGWAGGVLEGLRHLRDDEEQVCLLNSDTQVTPGWLSRLAGHLDAPEVDAVTPRELPASLWNDEETAVPAEPLPPTAEPRQPVRRRPPPTACLLRLSSTVQRRFAGVAVEGMPSGYCVLLKRRALPVLREYLQDFDRFHRRERRAEELFDGLSCRIAHDTFVYHARGGSGGYYDYEARS